MAVSILRKFGILPRPRPRPQQQHQTRAPDVPPYPIEPPVRQLPSTRPRALSELAPHPQQQSALFSKLPFELRTLIWEHVLARANDDDVIHLELGDGTVYGARCREEAPCHKLGFRHLCWKEISWVKDTTYDPPEIMRVRRIMPLLIVCRLTYQESIGLLYQRNTFDMMRCEVLLRLPKVIQLQRLQSIRRLSFSTAFRAPMDSRQWSIHQFVRTSQTYRLPDDASKWPAACKVIASLTQLEDLQIAIAVWCPNSSKRHPNDDESLLYVLKPLIDLRARHFTVILTEDVSDHVRRELGTTPFSLVQRERPGRGWAWDASDD